MTNFINSLFMTFWENVETELKYQNKTRKQLASKVGIDTTTISKGLSNNSIPSADIALKIANFLNISLESLLEISGNSSNSVTASEEQQNQIFLYKKHSELIKQAERLNPQQLKAIEDLMKTM